MKELIEALETGPLTDDAEKDWCQIIRTRSIFVFENVNLARVAAVERALGIRVNVFWGIDFGSVSAHVYKKGGVWANNHIAIPDAPDAELRARMICVLMYLEEKS